MKKETHRSVVIHWLNGRIFSKLLVAVVLLTMIGCGKHDDPPAQAGQGGGPAPNIKIAQPLTQQVTEWDEYTGRIEAVNSVDVRARVSGYLEKVNFKAGDLVRKGDLYF
jgi:Membrane-fusion protein